VTDRCVLNLVYRFCKFLICLSVVVCSNIWRIRNYDCLDWHFACWLLVYFKAGMWGRPVNISSGYTVQHVKLLYKE
jgi:hypothetical protein